MRRNGIIERFVEPERFIQFSVPWVDDNGKVRVNRGFRVQFNSAIGPYKGGLRFHPSVTASVIKFLGFEQTLKNSLTTLPMGGGKGGSDFDPKGKSDAEVMRFCQSFMNELYRHIGQFVDIPAGDIGVGAREVGYLFGQYKRIMGTFEGGTITGKGIPFGGSARPHSGHRLRPVLLRRGGHALHEERRLRGQDRGRLRQRQRGYIRGREVHAAGRQGRRDVRLQRLRLRPERHRPREDHRHQAAPPRAHQGVRGRGPGQRVSRRLPRHLDVKCDIALPCATQNEMDLEGAKALIANGCKGVFEGANMPLTPDAIAAVQGAGLMYSPGKASNAGGVATSGLEMTQNSMRLSWSFEEVDEKLQGIMKNIFHAAYDASVEVGKPGDLMVGANVAGFLKVAAAMMAQGVV